jgi:hypothetical protein
VEATDIFSYRQCGPVNRGINFDFATVPA